MLFIETIVHEENTYCVKGNRIIDTCLSSEFSLKRGYSYKVESLSIFEAFNKGKKNIPLNKEDKYLLINLTKLLEDRFNGNQDIVGKD